MDQDFQKHVRIVSTICICIGVFYLLALVFVSILSLMAAHNAPARQPLLPAALSVLPFFSLLGLLGVLHIATGRAFRVGRSWARVSMWVISIVNIGSVPIGTAFGVYAIWLLMKTRSQ